MKSARNILTISSLILAILANLPLRYARADKNDEEKTIKLHGVAGISPIGIARSPGKMLINQGLIVGEQIIWGGELLQAPFDAVMTIQLDDVGQVILKPGAIVRVSTTAATFDGGSGGRRLIASLAHGDVHIILRNDAEAYCEAGGSAFNASRGANFKIAYREKQPELNEITGKVEILPQNVQAARKIFPLGANGRPIAAQGKIQVRLRSTRNVQFQVTDENDRPLPDIPVIIILGSTVHGALGAGTATITTTTGPNGIASANFVGGTVKGTDTVTAQVSNTNVQWQGIAVFSPPPIPPLVKFGIPAAAATAGAATAVVVTQNNNNNSNKPGLGNGGVTVRP